MHPTQIDVVQSTFARVEELELEPALIFYEELFAATPHLRPLFSADMKKQHRMFIMALAYCVGSLHQLDAIRPRLEQLAIRHVGYGVLPEHYDVMRGPLLRMLRKVLGDDFTPEVENSWSEAYATISRIMLETTERHMLPARKTG